METLSYGFVYMPSISHLKNDKRTTTLGSGLTFIIKLHETITEELETIVSTT